MKITKKQFAEIINEMLDAAGMEDYGQKFDAAYKQPDGSYSGHPDEAERNVEEYDSGYQAGFRGDPPPATGGSDDWWAGYEDGAHANSMDDDIDEYRGFHESRNGSKRMLNEQFGVESMSPLVQFANDWAGLGSMVQEQIVTVVNGFIENNPEDVYEINPNALDMAFQRLGNSLNILGETNPDAEEVLAALEWAKELFLQGDAEVEADARAAGDIP